MLETTNKEKILKSIRKGLVKPFVSIKKDIDHDSNILDEFFFSNPKNFAEYFTDDFNSLVICHNEEDFLHALLTLKNKKSWKSLLTDDSEIINLLDTAGIAHSLYFEGSSHYVTTCHELLTDPSSIVFDGSKNNPDAIINAPAIIVYAYLEDIRDFLPMVNQKQESTVFEESSLFSFDLRNHKSLNKEVYLFLNIASEE